MGEGSMDDPRATAEQYFEVDGRRWRATDPAIPDRLRAELVAELMDARRAVAAGKRAASEEQVAAARRRVGHAKVALGERGAKWWEPPTSAALHDRLINVILALLRHRDPASSICPSDAARVAGGVGWRSIMGDAREVALALQQEQKVEVRHAGEPVSSIGEAHGPLRIARGVHFPG